jgi:2-polyprenyl-6-methoxyphenol hydroxylase-like FAD-dependent oxidoreductase
VGGGFGGLAAGIAFRQAGHEVVVFEKSPCLLGVSAGIALAENALKCLAALGVRDRFSTTPWSDQPATIRNEGGRVLVRRTLAQLTGGDEFVVVQRSRLLAALADQLPDSCVRRGGAVTSVTTEGRVVVDGESHQFDLVVGADGARGITRQTLWPGAPPLRSTGIVGWSWIVDLPLTEGFGSIWGRNSDFGILPLEDGRTYVYGSTRDGPADLSAYGGWPDPLGELIAAATPDAVTTVKLSEMRPPRRLADGRVVLIGDAAHAMRPTFGQGAALAMEDAITLARQGIEQLNRRRRRMNTLYWLSREGSWMSTPRHPLLASARDAALFLTPDPVFATLAGLVSQWSVPPGAPYEKC